jgi:hypothetical protein
MQIDSPTTLQWGLACQLHGLRTGNALGVLLTVTGAGLVTVTASQAGDTRYAAATPIVQSFTVAKATLVITWATPAAIIYGTPLSATQLNATATILGTFAYSPSAGVLIAGPHRLSVVFIPTNTSDYTVAGGSVTLLVIPAILTVTANSLAVPFGTAPVLGATITGFVNGDTISLVSGAPALSTTANALSLLGTYPITVGPGTLSAENGNLRCSSNTAITRGSDTAKSKIGQCATF